MADAVAVLDRLGVRRAAIYGHSMGSMVAQRFALAHPDRTAVLVLEGAFPGLKGNAAVDAFVRTEIAALGPAIDPTFARAFQESTLARPVPPAFLDLVVAETQKLPTAAMKAILADQMAIDFGPQLARIAAPTLILWGDQDAFAGAGEQARLKSGIKGAVLVTFEGTGHDPHWEEPERAGRLVGDFVQRHMARSPAEAAR
jgi:pimeloyl-ACP methyl ester carboxylesterase